MDYRYIKRSYPLMAAGLLGLLVFVLLLDNFFPYKTVNLDIDKERAIEIATDFMKKRGYNLDGYHVMAVISGNSNSLYYLQEHSGRKGREMFRNGHGKGLGFRWMIYWFKNLPASSQYEQFQIWLCGGGTVTGFTHEYPYTLDWPDGRNPHISQEQAMAMAQNFLRQQGINLENYKKNSFSSRTFDKRTDHFFSWKRNLDEEKGEANLMVTIQGDEVGKWKTSFHIPVDSLTRINGMAANKIFTNFVSYIFAFLFCLVIQVIFLKKYHEGEVGIKTALIVFLLCWVPLTLETLLRFRLNSLGTRIGELSPDSIGLVMVILFGCIIWPFLSIMSFSSYSVGAGLGRERFSRKLTSLDSILNKKFATLNVAHSMLNGYAAGLTGLGIVAGASLLVTGVFPGIVDNADYTVASTAIPFLIPFLTAIASSLLSEPVFRMFGNFILFKYLKSKPAAIFLSALPWTVFAMGLWKINISITPVYWEWVIWYTVGVFLGYIFWRFDLLTAILANFTITGVMYTLPFITSNAPGVATHGYISLVLLVLPAGVMVAGFIKKNFFSFEADVLPAHIQRITERARMAKELEIARKVQQQLLPHESPKIEGFEIQGVCLPANEVGGDYYDFIPIPPDHLGIVIGDVSGKGVPAAIYMTLTKGIVQSHVENQYPPEQILTRINRSLYSMMDRKSFVTMCLTVLDIKNKRLNFARAGHNPLLYFRKRDDQVLTLKPHGIALGIQKETIFDGVIEEGQIDLEKDDLLVLYTDGFSEAQNKDLQDYSEQRLCKTIQDHRHLSASEIIEAVLKDVNAFVKNYPQHDDMTMVIVKVF